MKLEALCPICDRQIDENVARLNGLWTVIILSIAIYTTSYFLALFLLIDFALRSATLVDYSPLACLSKRVASLFRISPRLINAGPKLFAVRIGFLFSLVLFLSFVAGWPSVSLLVTLIFAFFAALEALMGFCVACRIYPYIYKLTYRIQK